jgi:hypothetical protein
VALPPQVNGCFGAVVKLTAAAVFALACSEEVPRCSRQLPAWREKWVTGILQQLQGMQQQH